MPVRPARRWPVCSSSWPGRGRIWSPRGTPPRTDVPAGATSGCRWTARPCWRWAAPEVPSPGGWPPSSRAGCPTASEPPLFRGAEQGQGVGMDETDILSRIHALVDEEHKLREGTEHTDDDKSRMSKIEADLDQCWDL